VCPSWWYRGARAVVSWKPIGLFHLTESVGAVWFCEACSVGSHLPPSGCTIAKDGHGEFVCL
jgi:hypothetical protein